MKIDVAATVSEARSGPLTLHVTERVPGDLLLELDGDGEFVDVAVVRHAPDVAALTVRVLPVLPSVERELINPLREIARDELAEGRATFDAPAGAGESVEASRG